jgi:hypothetical protein
MFLLLRYYVEMKEEKKEKNYFAENITSFLAYYVVMIFCMYSIWKFYEYFSSLFLPSGPFIYILSLPSPWSIYVRV